MFEMGVTYGGRLDSRLLSVTLPVGVGAPSSSPVTRDFSGLQKHSLSITSPNTLGVPFLSTATPNYLGLHKHLFSTIAEVSGVLSTLAPVPMRPALPKHHL